MLNLSNAKLRISAGSIAQFPRDALPQIAFSGRSNVGKSSLINTLLGRKSLARVSGTPGKTITINFYEIDNAVILADLPGYGYAKRPAEERAKWSALTDGYFTKNPASDLLRAVVQLVDSRIGPTDDDRMMIDYMNRVGLPYLIVATKVDKLNKTERAKSLASLEAEPLFAKDTPIIPFSSLSGEGKDRLWKELMKKV